MILELRNREDIVAAAASVRWLSRPPVEKVVVSLPGLEDRRRARLEKQLKFLFNDCGCLWAAPAFMIVFGFRVWNLGQAHAFSWTNLAFAFVAGISAAFAAKFVALAWSYQRLKACFRRIGDTEAGMK